MRIKPRFNPEINKWWICDRGRFGYRFIDENRIEQPYIKDGEGQTATSWEQALSEVSTLIKNGVDAAGSATGLGVIVSPRQTNEELEQAKELFVNRLGAASISFQNPWEKPGPEDDLLMKADCNPNSRGAADLGLDGDTRTILKKAADGELKTLVVFSHDFENPESLELIRRAEKLIYIGSNWNETAREADVALPSAVFAEKDGSFTNFEGRKQDFTQAFLPLGESRPETEILEQLAQRIDKWN